MRLGILGGTFDPVHYAHLAIAEEARVQLGLERVIFVPAGQPPHKLGEVITPVHYRLTMLELALASNPHFLISRVDLERPGPSYTVDTLALIQERWGPGAELYFIIGADSLLGMHSWHHPERIIEAAQLAVVPRLGNSIHLPELEKELPGLSQKVTMIQAPLLEISGTDLRRRVREGRSIKYYVPEEVEAYIFKHGLYQGGE
ncbi:MAG: nicotinate-nucleotide adenylyltransferase [Chloroflexota bacterium]|nr:nicotinate-nucleotide adenylyltransferase [Chloroflexota bacterium]